MPKIKKNYKTRAIHSLLGLIIKADNAIAAALDAGQPEAAALMQQGRDNLEKAKQGIEEKDEPT